MAKMQLGTEQVVWDLTAFYAGPSEVAIQIDLAAVVDLMAVFEANFKGKLHTRLGEALVMYQDISRKMTKLQAYFDLCLAKDSADGVARKEGSRVQEALAAAQGKYLTFFDLEVGAMDDVQFEALVQADNVVQHHEPMLRHTRKLAAHYLPEEVEKNLMLRSPFGAGEWADMMGELETKLRFELDGKTYNLPEILNVLSEDRDGEKRARALVVLNEGLVGQRHPFFVARTLNVVAGSHLVDCEARGFTSPMQPVNLGNRVDDATVAALHEAVATKGAELGRRYYMLKAKLLGMKTLRWSDRNASMPFAPHAKYSWDEACAIVRRGYGDFSPTLLGLVDEVLGKNGPSGWVDAPPAATKVSGAFDATLVLPEGVRSYMLLNYLGGVDDVMTLAHELGHAVHGMLAAEKQGPLMWHAPLVYAETASIFGEMLTFESLLPTLTDPQDKLALYMDKIGSFLNTVLRQINFSIFEQAMYEKRKAGKLSSDELDALWVEKTVQFYGPDGEVFTYENIEHLWSYISHFYGTNFYVYAYAFGELFTQSLMATRGAVGADFEPLYLELLRAGNTKDAVQLVGPFGLNPTEGDFWMKGLEGSVGKWLEEAERLVLELGL